MSTAPLCWATVDPESLGPSHPALVKNFFEGEWQETHSKIDLPDPLTGEIFLHISNTSPSEVPPFIDSCRKIPKSGLHNPLKNVQRYRDYGSLCARVASLLQEASVLDFFVRLIQRTAPKSRDQALGELLVVRTFFENFSGDQVRFLAGGHTVPGDRLGQQSQSYRWPYGPVAIISPFNFPLEIPVLQLMGALFMGNFVTIKPDPKVALCFEQFFRMLLHCGLPRSDANVINGHGEAMECMIRSQCFRMLQFTGSSVVANKLAEITKGKIKIEDAGFDWKLLGPDVADFENVCAVSDADAYAFGGQKCSAQSIVFAHSNWVERGFFDKIKELAGKRNLGDLSNVPILTWSNKRIQEHVDRICAIPGAYLLFGGEVIRESHRIPEIYGSYLPTAVFVPIDQIGTNFESVTTELFGPFQVVTEWSELNQVIPLLEAMDNHLTAAVVSNDVTFLNEVLGSTVNGTTYAGIRARTTGAPQNHWFGPCGDPRAAGIGTPYAITMVWSAHREIIMDINPVQKE